MPSFPVDRGFNPDSQLAKKDSESTKLVGSEAPTHWLDLLVLQFSIPCAAVNAENFGGADITIACQPKIINRFPFPVIRDRRR
jgi:hypothetical protein